MIFVLAAVSFLFACSRPADDGAKSTPKQQVRSQSENNRYRRGVADRAALIIKEETVVESATWFGKTGLSDALERELPRYLRREFGQTLFDAKSLKAADLSYLGAFKEGAARVHYWRVPYRDKEVYAYIEITPSQTFTGWGNRTPRDIAAK